MPICDHCLKAKSSLSKSQSWQVQLSAACSVGLEITLVSHMFDILAAGAAASDVQNQFCDSLGVGLCSQIL